ncbi:MAG: hypothetical protein QOE09_2919 [Ilumatobacteraceae bacterium]|jgi:predicted dithiol-disulfide oxidoreductase (DUF899 family)
MTLPEIVSSDEWRKARVELLADEKAMTKARDALSTKRRMLPMVRIDKDYRFEGPEGSVSLLDMFDGHRQLIIQHFMFDPSWEDGCPSCTAGSDELSAGLLRHLDARGTAFAVVSRAPLEKLERYKKKRGWDFRWYSSFGTDFNYDFHVTLDSSIAPVEYNFRRADELEAHGMEWMLEGSSEQPGYSTFIAQDGEVFHTNSVFARGTEWLGGSYAFLDLTVLGRQEDWEEPKGRADNLRVAVPDFAN